MFVICPSRSLWGIEVGKGESEVEFSLLCLQQCPSEGAALVLDVCSCSKRNITRVGDCYGGNRVLESDGFGSESWLHSWKQVT